jgi:hypothetical protein
VRALRMAASTLVVGAALSLTLGAAWADEPPADDPTAAVTAPAPDPAPAPEPAPEPEPSPVPPPSEPAPTAPADSGPSDGDSGSTDSRGPDSGSPDPTAADDPSDDDPSDGGTDTGSDTAPIGGVDTGTIEDGIVDPLLLMPSSLFGAPTLAADLDPYLENPSVSYEFTPAGVIVTGGYVGESADGAYTDLGEDIEGFEATEPRCDWPAPGGDEPVCTYTSLSPGSWAARSQQTSSETDSNSSGTFDEFYIPGAPGLSAVLQVDHTVLFSGTGEFAETIQVEFTNHNVACTAEVDEGGGWECSGAALGIGSHTFRALQIDEEFCECSTMSGGTSAYSATATVIRSAPSTPSPSPTPTPIPPPPPPAPLTWSFDLTGFDPANAHPGDQFTANGSGLPPGSSISGEIHSRVVALGSTQVASDGTFTMPVTVPDLESGDHEIVLTMTGAGFAASSSAQGFTIVGPAEVPAPPADNGEAETPGASGEGEGTETAEGGTEGGVHESPNVLTHGLTTFADLLEHPAKISAAIAIGLVLLVFAVLPAHLLNATVAEQYERFRRRAPRLLRVPAWFARLTARLYRTPGVAGLALTSLTAVLFAFADPRFGFTLASLRLILALAIALGLVVYLANALAGVIMRRGWNVDVEVRIRPLGILLTIAGVIASRILDFSPGFLVGIVLGLSIVERAASRYAWRAVVVRTVIVLGMALGAWVAFSILTAAEGEREDFLTELVLETLVAITTEGIAMLLVVLLPFKLLEGEPVFERSRVLWAVLYSAALLVFLLAVVPFEGNWEVLGDSLWAWIGAVVGFGVVCTAIYVYLRFFAPPLHVEHVADDELVALADRD